MLASSASVFSQTSPSVFGERINAFSPTALDGLALWADANDQNSLLASDGSVIEDGEAVALWSDKSGNSAENCLVLNGVSGNNARTPTAAPLEITGDIGLAVKAAFGNWGQFCPLVYKDDGAIQRSYLLAMSGSSPGRVVFGYSNTGATISIVTSTVSVGFSAYSTHWIGATRNSTTGDVTFYTSNDGVTWAQLGAVVSTAPSAIAVTTSSLSVGQNSGGGGAADGIIFNAKVFAGDFNTVPVFDADFTRQAKLATSFVESSVNAATVTINTTGANGARISGARDLYQGTVANRGTYSSSEKSVTTDGSNDYLKAATFSQTQPVTLYAAMQQVTWTSGDYLFDGNSANTLALIQTTSTPQLNISAGSSVAANTDLAVATKGVVSMVINGASSSLRIDRDAETTGNAGAGNANGFTIGAKADGTAPGNGKYYEALVYSGAHDAATRDRIALYLAKKWGIAV